MNWRLFARKPNGAVGWRPYSFRNLTAWGTVVDLGCGGGLDVFLATDKVGPSGKAIDMTDKMLELSRRNAAR